MIAGGTCADQALRAASRLVVAGLVTACTTPTPALVLALSDVEDQKCPSTDCAEVPLPCKAVMSIRIVDRDDPSTVYHSQCSEVPFGQKNTMCALRSVEVEPVPIPVRPLIVEVAVFPASRIPSDPMDPDKLVCADRVRYSDANGFPVETYPTPVLGGRAFYHPGDPQVDVKLGCTDLRALEESCATSDLVTVRATVDDFQTLSSVPPGPGGIASMLHVMVGEPRFVDEKFVLPAGETRALVVNNTSSVPTWQSDVDLKFSDWVCVEVTESVPQTTAVVRCRPVAGSSRLDVTGMWISRENVQKILSAMAPLAPPPVKFPDEGLTVGVVVDQASIGVPDMIVTPAQGTVRYLTGQGMLTAGSTSNTGIFVSRDAPFGTVFATSGPGRPIASGIGGLVSGKITVVVLQVGNQPQ